MSETDALDEASPRFCPGCGNGVQGDPRFCEKCGGSLQPGQAAAPPPPPSAGWAAPAPTKTNGLAIASLVLGILWLYWIGSILALIFGFIAKSQIDRSNGTQTGRGMAVAGIVLGLIGIVVPLLAIAAITFLGEEAEDKFTPVGDTLGLLPPFAL